MIRPCYEPKMAEFKSLYETIGYLFVRESPKKLFFNYGYNRENPKNFCSHYRRRITNSFFGTIFNRHRKMIESGKDEIKYSNIYFFLPSIRDRHEEKNKYLKNILIFPVEITQYQLNGWTVA